MNSINLSFMLFLTFIAIWCIITYMFGDWRNWRLYYPTILFFWCGDLIGFLVFHDHLLWEFKSNILSHDAIDMIEMLFIFTCTTILFLQYYPKKFTKQIVYILLWVFIYSILEWAFHLFGVIVYHYGWSIWWSLSHNIYQFIFLRLHHKKPILAWILAFITLGITMVIFKVSI